jgi:hypothetical protein
MITDKVGDVVLKAIETDLRKRGMLTGECR